MGAKKPLTRSRLNLTTTPTQLTRGPACASGHHPGAALRHGTGMSQNPATGERDILKRGILRPGAVIDFGTDGNERGREGKISSGKDSLRCCAA